MLMDRHKSSLLIVDVQARLLPAIADGEAVLGNCIWLAGVARRVGVPVVVSEQYPEGLGRTAEPLLAAVGDAPVVTKTHFSCVADGCLEGSEFKRVRWVTVETADGIDRARFGALLEDALALARMGHRGRLTRALDGT